MEADIDEMQRKPPSHSLPSQERMFGLPADDDMQQEYDRSRKSNGSLRFLYIPLTKFGCVPTLRPVIIV